MRATDRALLRYDERDPGELRDPLRLDIGQRDDLHRVSAFADQEGHSRRVAGIAIVVKLSDRARYPGDLEEGAKTVKVTAGDTEFEATVRIDTPNEWQYYRHGGILHYVLRSLNSDD